MRKGSALRILSCSYSSPLHPLLFEKGSRLFTWKLTPIKIQMCLSIHPKQARLYSCHLFECAVQSPGQLVFILSASNVLVQSPRTSPSLSILSSSVLSGQPPYLLFCLPVYSDFYSSACPYTPPLLSLCFPYTLDSPFFSIILFVSYIAHPVREIHPHVTSPVTKYHLGISVFLGAQGYTLAH